MTTTVRPTGDLIETFPIRFADGRTYHAGLHRTGRHGGRRVVVWTRPGGEVLFDSDDCHDSGNVRAKLEEWLASVE